MNDSIANLINAAEDAGVAVLPGDQIQLIHRDRIIPKPGQNRDDWDHPETIAHVQAISRTMQIKLDSGAYYGIRAPLLVEQENGDGMFTLIDGECRWRASENVPDDLKVLPCLVRSGNKLENQLDHASLNGARKQLTLLQVARAIKRDKEELKIGNDELADLHGLRDKKAVSKVLAVLKLPEEAMKYARDGSFKDVNLIYELRELSSDELKQLDKKIAKGESFQQALKSVTKKKKDGAADGQKPAPAKAPQAGEGKGSDSEPRVEGVAMRLSLRSAHALAELLGIDGSSNMTPTELAQHISQQAESLVAQG